VATIASALEGTKKIKGHTAACITWSVKVKELARANPRLIPIHFWTTTG
jgi:hypothetical protein